MAGDIARTVTVTGFGNMSQLEAALERAGFVAESTSKTITGAAADAGKAAAKQAQEMGLSADKQVAAAGRAAAASVEASKKITAAQKAAAAAAGKAAEAFGLSADEQVAASDRAMASQAKLEAESVGASSRMGTMFTKLGSTMGAWGIPFSHSVSKMGADIQSAEGHAAGLSAKMGAVGKVAAFGGLAAFGAAAYEGVKGAVALEKQMEMIHTQAGASQAEVKRMTGAVEGMAGSVATGPQQLAESLYHVESAGLRGSKALEVLKFAAEGAKVGGANIVDVQNALDAAVVSGISGVQNYGQAMGALNSIVGAGDMKMQDLADALGTGLLAPMKTYGLSLRDVGAALAVFGDNNIRGQDAATKLTSAVRIMGAPSAAASKALGVVGLSTLQLASDMRTGGLVKALEDLHTHLVNSGATAEQQGLIIARAFGGRQSTGVQVLLGQLDRLKEKQQAVGQGSKNFGHDWEATTHTLGFAFDQAKAAVQGLSDKLGFMLIPELKAVGHGLADGVQWLERHKTAARDLGAVIAGVLGLAVAVFAERTAVKFRNAVMRMGSDMGGLASSIKGAVAKIIGLFGAEAGASEASAARISGAANESATAVQVEAERIGAAEGVMADETVAAAGTIDAALMTTGIGVTVVALGVAAFELQEHWSEVMHALEEGAVKAANAIVEALNKAKEAAEDMASGGILPILRALGVVHGPVIPSIPGVSKSGGSQSGGSSGGMPQLQSSMDFGGVNTAQLPAITRAAHKYHISPNTLMGVYGTETDYGKNVTTSSAGAEGAFQFIRETAKAYNYPYTNKQTLAIFEKQAQAAAHYLSDLIKQHHGNVHAALEQYSGQTLGYAQNVTQKGLSHAQEVALGIGKESAAEKASKAAKRKAASYFSPFLDPAGLHRGREDEGIDFSGLHPGARIGAIGSGVIDKIVKDWYKGQPLIEEQLTSGAHKGQYVYYAEQLKALVHAGQRVKAGQAIGTVAPSGTGLELGFGAGGGRTLAQATTGYKEGQVTPAAVEFSKFLGTVGKPGSALGVANEVASQIAKALAAQLKALHAQGTKELKTYQADIQSGSVKSLEKLLGSTTKDRTGIHSEAHKEFGQLVSSLRATHEKALVQLAAQLVGAHRTALSTLNSELKAAQENAAARTLNLQATEMKDQTQIQASMAAKVVQAMQDAATLMVDGINNAATALRDAGQAIADQYAAQAQAIKDKTQSMTDASNAAVTQIQDKSQTVVDELGERGLYGLNLVAQKQQVGLDQMKTGYDAQIAQAQQALDTAQTATDKGAAATKALVDATTAQQDVLIGQAQMGFDSARQQTNMAVQNAQQNLDNVTAATDKAVQAAQSRSDAAATGSKAQQDSAAAALSLAQGNQAAQVAQAQAALTAAQNAANSAVQQAQDTLSAAQAHGSLAEQEAANALASAEGNAGVVLAQAAQVLANTQNLANLSEAEQKALVEKTKAEASTQYAGSGLTVNISNVPTTDAAAIASEIGWIYRTRIPA